MSLPRHQKHEFPCDGVSLREEDELVEHVEELA
jgi:hypothetical protein